MLIRTEADVTDAVLKVMERTKDKRLREIMVALIKHLHGFVRDVRLTEDEFRMATKLINALGQHSNDKHNDAVLMAGSLGVSTLVCLLNNGDDGATETTQNLLGPFWRLDSPRTELGGTIVRSETPGQPMAVNLTFNDVNGQPIEGLEVDVWHCSAEGFYENQDENQADYNLRGKFTTGDDGRVWFHSIKQSGYPIPTNTVVGPLLEAQDRHPFRPAHLHVLAHKENYKTLISQIYSDDDPYLESDVQFGVTKALIGHYEWCEDADPHGMISEPHYQLNHTLMVEAGESRLPDPPIK